MTALAQRTHKAAQLVAGNFYNVTALTHNRVKAVVIPGSQAKQYEVLLTVWKLHTGQAMYTECRISTAFGDPPCKGNSNGHICYHAITALMVRAARSQVSISFCSTAKSADRLSRLGGRVVDIYSRQGRGQLWAVIKKS